MDTNAMNAQPLGGEVMFYRRPEPLSIESHGSLGLTPSQTPFLFARPAQAVPIIVGEFGPCSLNYPIVFAGSEYQPLAVMSLQQGQNLFIDAAGNFPIGCYIPAFIRRYPFVFAHGDNEPDRLIVCIDRDADIVGEHAQIPFFEGGEPSAFTKQCIDFCSNFEAERRKTEDFVKLLREHDLFELRTINFTPTFADGSLGQPMKLAEHFSPSEARIKALPDEVQLQMIRSGAMQQIHLHWNSLLNWERLVAEMGRQNAAASPPTLNA